MKFGGGSDIKVDFMPLALHELSIFTNFVPERCPVWRSGFCLIYTIH